ncbi:MAG: DUF3179 domain-containing protein [Acidobacteria bacterium]|nr:DUF3179 domain-containing protein [Acidobacteriota bacterium]
MVYARTVGTKKLTLIVSGMLWRDSLIMMDKETESLWSHVLGKAVKGPMEGSTLKMLPSTQTTWAAWSKAHPKTKLLAKGEEVTNSHYQGYFDDPEKMGIFRARRIIKQMPGKALVWGVAQGPHAAALTDEAVGASDVASFSLGEMPAIALRGADDGVRAFVARGDGQALKLVYTEAGVLKDTATSSVWDKTTGVALQGKLAGTKLEELPVTRVYWFAWSSFYPNTQVVE